MYVVSVTLAGPRRVTRGTTSINDDDYVSYKILFQK